MRYVVLSLVLILVGSGCAEVATEESSGFFIESGINGLETMLDQSSDAIQGGLDDFAPTVGSDNGVWSHVGNTLSSDQLSFTTFFDTYVNLSASDDEMVVRVQNYDPLLDALIDGGFFAWFDLDAAERGDAFTAYFDSFEDVQFGGRTWVAGINILGAGDVPARGYRYEDGTNQFEILVYTNDEQGLERAGDFVQTLEFLD
ncbi:MAG: hypothetical protein P8J32_01725 [bacterium]|jgi:hypothetical protein|nr:hypothetical protein [bacterium]